MSPSRYKTARCILEKDAQFLLAVHGPSSWLRRRDRWGLPGGRIEAMENPEEAVRRELIEELDVWPGVLHRVGAYPYKGRLHCVFGSVFEGEIGEVDGFELLEVRWFSEAEVLALARNDELHGGFEHRAIRDFANLRSRCAAMR